MISSLVAFTLRVALVAASTFLFVVLFEHGPANYLENARADFQTVYELVQRTCSPVPEKSPDGGT
jgi:hypothetical protein